MERVGAFFDLDGTLLSVNSGKLWVDFERRGGRITRRTYVEALIYLLAYKLGRIDMDVVMRKALATVKDDPEGLIRERTERWYLDEVASRVAPGGRRTLHQHRLAGHELVLLTSSSPYEAALAAKHLGLHGWLSSQYEVRHGLFTGDFVEPLCYGAGKVKHAERYAGVRGIDLAQSYFYSDSVTDVPMLERVAHGVAVNPDPRLRREARRRGWPVEDWHR